MFRLFLVPHVLMCVASCRPISRENAELRDVVFENDRSHIYRLNSQTARVEKLRCSSALPKHDGRVDGSFSSQCLTVVGWIELNEFRSGLVKAYRGKFGTNEEPVESAVEYVLADVIANPKMTFFFNSSPDRNGILYEVLNLVPSMFPNDPLVNPGPMNPVGPPPRPIIPEPNSPVVPEVIAEFRQISDGAPSSIGHGNRARKKVSELWLLQRENVVIDGNSGLSGEIQFTLPEHTVGLSVVIENRAADDYMFVHTLTDGTGKPLISPTPTNVRAADFARGRGQQLSKNAMSYSEFKEVSTTPVPINDRIDLSSGSTKWKLTIARESPKGRVGKVNVFVIAKKLKHRTRVEHLEGRLGLKLYFSPGNLTGTEHDGANSTAIKKMIDFYANNGISIAVTNSTPLSSKYDDANPLDRDTLVANASFNRLMGWEKEAGSVNLFLLKPHPSTPFLNMGTFGGATLSNLPGNLYGGIVIQERVAGSNGMLAAHELGHHLGLYHTGDDSISDTFDFNHWLEGDQGRAQPNRVSNLMNAPQGGKMILTNGQKFVIMRNPAVALYE